MKEGLPKDGMSKKLISIGEASKFLGVSIDSIRRWDKQGILHSSRPNGKDRFFSINELEKVKFSAPLPISEAASRLGISETTLRRLEEKRLIFPERNNQGERLYSRECLKNFLDSNYYLRQKEVEDKILEPEEAEETDQERSQRLLTQRKVINARLEEHQNKIGRLIIFRNIFYTVGLFLVTLLIFTVIIVTLLFLSAPTSTAQWLGYRTPLQLSSSSQLKDSNKNGPRVLGAEYNPNNKNTPKNVFAKILKPVSEISLGVVKKINPEIYYEVVPSTIINNVNDVLGITSNNEVTSRYNFTFPDTSYLHIPDTNLITNLNADYLRGRVPGNQTGNLAVFDANNFIDGLKVEPSNISGKISESDKVAGSAVELSSGGGLMNNHGLSLTTKCASGELLTWNGAAWVCIADISGNSENVTGKVEANHGGTGQTTYSNGQLLIGNAAGGLTKSTLTAGANIIITNGEGSITIAAAGGGANTITNVGAGGVGLYRDTIGATYNFKNINIGSNKLSVTDDLINSEIDLDVIEANLAHNSLGGLTTGDAHTQYALLAGRAGGQIVIGGSGASENLTFQTTSNGVKGSYIFSDLGSGLVKSTAGTLSVTTDNSANWDTAYTWRLTSASGTAPLTLSLAANALTGSIADAAADGATKGISTFTTNDFDALAGVISTDYTNGQAATGLVKGFLTAGDWTTFSTKQGALTFGNLTAASNKIAIGGTGVGALIGAGASVDINEGNLTHNNLSGLTTGDPHTQYALLAGRAGGQIVTGGTASGDDLTLRSTSNATKGDVIVNNGSFIVQPNAGTGVSSVMYQQTANNFSSGWNVSKRGTTGDNTAALASGAELGFNSFSGWDGTVYKNGGWVLVKSTQAWDADSHGTSFHIGVTPNDASAAITALTIDQDRSLYLNSTIYFGNNTAAGDTGLGRLAANILGTLSGDKFVANAGLGVGNSAAATTLGSVAKKMEVFDAAGASLGFVPIYDAIN